MGGVVAGLEGFMFRGDRQERFGRWMGKEKGGGG